MSSPSAFAVGPGYIGHSDGLTRRERRGQCPIDAARQGVDAAGLGIHRLEGIRLGMQARLGATIA